LKNKGGFAVTKRSTTTLEFASCKKRKVKADFGGGEITSDAGVMLLREISGTGLTELTNLR